jgi:hypothetical protein
MVLYKVKLLLLLLVVENCSYVALYVEVCRANVDPQ